MEIRTKLLLGCSLALPLVLTSCAPQVQLPTKSCSEAFNAASIAVQTLDSTSPVYGPNTDEVDALMADGEVTSEEQSLLDAWYADYDAQLVTITAPLYQACNGVGDFFAGAYWQGENGSWGAWTKDQTKLESFKEIFLTTYCTGHESEISCSGFSAAK